MTKTIKTIGWIILIIAAFVFAVMRISDAHAYANVGADTELEFIEQKGKPSVAGKTCRNYKTAAKIAGWATDFNDISSELPLDEMWVCASSEGWSELRRIKNPKAHA